jgi:hypothetical protein
VQKLEYRIEVAVFDDMEDRREGLAFDRSGLSADLDERRADKSRFAKLDTIDDVIQRLIGV